MSDAQRFTTREISQWTKVAPDAEYVPATYHDRIVAEKDEAHAAALAAQKAEWEAGGPYFTSLVHECCEVAQLAVPSTLTADDDCMHLAEVYVGEGKRGSVIECLMCGGLRSDDSTVPPERVPRTLTADSAEPAVGSIVRDRCGEPWKHDSEGWTCAGWDDPQPWSTVLRFGPVTLIHDGGA